jgi:hypothetical protein
MIRRPLFTLCLAAALFSGCDALVNFDPEGQPCAAPNDVTVPASQQCLWPDDGGARYTCGSDGKCHRFTGDADAGTTTDAG